MPKFGAMRTLAGVGASATHSRTVSIRSAVKPVVPTTAWMPWSIAKRMLSMTTSGWVKSTSTWEPASATLNSQSPASTIATSSRSSAASTALHTCSPMRPRAPRTPTLMGSLIVPLPLSHRTVEVVLAERPHHGQASRPGEDLPGHGGDVVSGNRVDAAEELVHADHVAVRDLALADAGHPRAGVLETEDGRPPHLPLAPLDLRLGQPVRGHGGVLGEDQREDLVGLPGLAAGVDAEHAGVGVPAGERVHGVGEAALLPDALEQPRAHAAAEGGRQHAQRVARRVVAGQPPAAEDDVGLLGVVGPNQHRPGGRAVRRVDRSAAGGRRPERRVEATFEGGPDE